MASVHANVRLDTIQNLTTKYPQAEFPLMQQSIHVRNARRIHVRSVLAENGVNAINVSQATTSMFIIRTATVKMWETVHVALILSGLKTCKCVYI